MSDTAILINGRSGEHFSIQDRGLQYGDGVFETVAVAGGEPAYWPRHLARLLRGCTRLGFDPLPDAATLTREVGSLAAGWERAVIKLIITRGIGARGYAPRVDCSPTRVLWRSGWPDFSARHAVDGVAVRYCRTTVSRNPALAGIKHLNRLEQVLARSEWNAEFAEGLMLDDRGRVIEGTMSNVFLVHQDTLVTPDLSESGIAGIMREVVMENAGQLGIPVTVAPVERQQLAAADAIFLTNSLIGIWPVRRIENQDYAINDIVRRLQETIAH